MQYHRGISRHTFAANLTKAMHSLNLGQTQMAKLTGIDVTKIHRLMRERQLPQVWTVQRILATTPITYEELVGLPVMVPTHKGIGT